MITRGYARGGKRLFDVAASGGLLLLGLPVLAAVATAVRTRIGSPVFFRQRRPGRGGKPFTILKFRTMTDARGPDGALLSDAARLTDLGRWLRRTSLDELPELLNVLRGDMSLVGPRPLLDRYRPHYTPRERTREDVRPGITGLAQVTGRNLLDWDTRLETDARYVESLSLLGDLRILARTVQGVLRSSGVEVDPRGAMLDLDVQRTVRVEPAGPAQAEHLVRLHREAFEPRDLETTIFAGHGVAAYYQDALARENEHRAYAAWGGEQLLGYAHVRALETSSHLNQIATAPAARGRGIGGKLLQTWIDHARGRGAQALTLDVREGTPAASWYRGRGFEAVERTNLWRVHAVHEAPSGPSSSAAPLEPGHYERYGFDTIEVQHPGGLTRVGRLGPHDLRVAAGPDPSVLQALRSAVPGRRLLVVGGEAPPLPEAEHLHAVLRMQREVA